MDMNNLANGFELEVPSSIQTAFCDKTLTTEILQDFTLPDYQPEMRKLLRVTPSILPPSRFLGAGEAEFAGNVTFTVLYTGGDGALYTTELSAPYTFRVPLEDNDRFAGNVPMQIDAELSTDTTITRVSAPRKLNIKCRLRARVTGLCDEETDMSITGETAGSATLEKLERTHACGRTLFATGEALELTDEMTVAAPASGEGELRLIENSGVVQVTEATPVEGGIACRGELYWKAAVTRDRMTTEGEEDSSAANGEIELLTRRIPFSQTVEMPLPSSQSGWEAMAHGTCTGINARVEGDRILAAATILLEVQAQGSDRVTFVCDCFSTAREGGCEMRKFTYNRAIACINGNVTESGNISYAEAGIPQGAIPLELTGVAAPTGVVCERGHLILGGECLYQMLYRTPEGELGSAEFRLPLRYEVPIEGGRCEDGAYGASARMDLLGGRARPEGDGFAIDAEWAIAARMYAAAEVEAVGEACFEGMPEERRGAYVLCYPEAGETLWAIAKRYHTSIRPLAALNNLPGSADPASPMSLEGTRFLMIG